jgi:hypothetical protein
MQSKIYVNEKKIAGKVMPSYVIDEDYIRQHFGNDQVVMGLMAIIDNLEHYSGASASVMKKADSSWNVFYCISDHDGYDDDVEIRKVEEH